MQRNRSGPKFENSYQKLNVPREEEEEEQHSNQSHDHAAKAAGKNGQHTSGTTKICDQWKFPGLATRTVDPQKSLKYPTQFKLYGQTE